MIGSAFLIISAIALLWFSLYCFLNGMNSWSWDWETKRHRYVFRYDWRLCQYKKFNDGRREYF